MDFLLGLLSSFVAEHLSNQVTRKVKLGLSPLAPYLRHLAIGVLLVLLSGTAWFSGLIFLLISFFLYLGGLGQAYLTASLWTAVVSFLIGLVLLISGLRTIRKPR